MAAVREAMLAVPWGPDVAGEIRSMRERLEASAPPRSLKRGPGGMTDVEFLTQAFQLRLGRRTPGSAERTHGRVWTPWSRRAPLRRRTTRR